MDLGTANTIIMQDNQVIIDQPSVVAIRTADDPLHSVAKAPALHWRTPITLVF